MEILNVVIGIVVLIVAVWIAIFGGIGALLSKSRGSSGAGGLAWGALLGPFGWAAILWVTRGRARYAPAQPAASPETASTSTTDPWDV